SSNTWSVRVQLFTEAEVPSGGSVTAQPPRSVSNEVSSVVTPSRVTAASSRKTPAPWVAQSLTYVIETSTCLPAYGVRSIRHCCQPPELPEAAFQEPEAPVGSQFGPWYRWVNGWMLLQPDWQLLPVSWL